ncbi:winged helix-turn-helix domain-containing protein [[Ruminococcus] lactaris]|uniref:winged helix-turn-helix domain-containing protein n=1 Tax=[Ruminococcus] lactaris TaxID=46228 RepID=UPI001F171C8E|nr:winged helix-turn-helix domain-containing protein [[Ruminococcus] lactaris]
MQYILEQGVSHGTVFNSCHTFSAAEKNPLTEIQEGELYLCLEHRTVRVRERIINLTSKEFDILALLIANPKRVFTYELITDLVWNSYCCCLCHSFIDCFSSQMILLCKQCIQFRLDLFKSKLLILC